MSGRSLRSRAAYDFEVGGPEAGASRRRVVHHLLAGNPLALDTVGPSARNLLRCASRLAVACWRGLHRVAGVPHQLVRLRVAHLPGTELGVVHALSYQELGPVAVDGLRIDHFRRVFRAGYREAHTTDSKLFAQLLVEDKVALVQRLHRFL